MRQVDFRQTIRLSDPRRVRRGLIVGLSLIVAVFGLLRFANLEADFPAGLTRSGVLYTDEGWYASAASRHVINGHWYLPGDFNPAVNMPLGQILHRLAFELFGLSLSSARMSSAVGYITVILLTAIFVYRRAALTGALLAAVILASNYVGFAYSRLAIMEPAAMAFVAAGLLFSDRARGKGAALWATAAAVSVGAATLVKGSMIFAVPVAAYAVWLNAESGWQRRALLSAITLALPLLILAGYQATTMQFFPADFAYFRQLNVESRMVTGVGDWLYNVLRKLWQMRALGFGFLVVSALLITSAWVVSPRFRGNSAVRVLLAYGFAYFTLLTVVSYGPPRYFVPMLVPLAGLDAIACIELTRQSQRGTYGIVAAILAPLLVAGVVFSESLRIGTYIFRPSYSFVRMATGVEEIILRREGRVKEVVLMGDAADTVALETGIRAANARVGTYPMARRFELYRPAYVLVHADEAKILNSLRSAGGRATELRRWDVFGNYKAGQKVKLFYVGWGRSAGSE